MMSSFTTLWPKHRCQAAARLGLERTCLSLLFGGPHQSEPSFVRAGVQPGDVIYVVRVNKGVVHVVADLNVSTIYTVNEYMAAHRETFADVPRVIGIPGGKFGGWLQQNPELAFLAPTCTEEVIVGHGTLPISLERPVAPETLALLRFRSNKRERALKHIKDGRLTSIIGLQGIYRLTEESAGLLRSNAR